MAAGTGAPPFRKIFLSHSTCYSWHSPFLRLPLKRATVLAYVCPKLHFVLFMLCM